MKYIKTDKIGVVTEHVGKDHFVADHGDVSGWELVSDEECQARCDANQSLIDAERLRKQAESDRKIPQRKVKRQEASALRKEFAEFKAWKAGRV